jgi:hypothetical protein
MRRGEPVIECVVVRLVLERERELAGLERLLGSDAVAAVKALAADGVVIRHGEHLWASPALSRLAELELIAAGVSQFGSSGFASIHFSSETHPS